MAVCVDCGGLAQWHCDECKDWYCNNCWGRQVLHRKAGSTHLKTSHENYLSQQRTGRKIKEILKPQWTTAERLLQYETDLATLWFSVDRKQDGPLEFEDFPRFTQLMLQHRQENGSETVYYPRLVSFIGTTGAGKSTLIRMLMERPWDMERGETADDLAVPVVGRHESTVPTSGDVHLYLDSCSHPQDFTYPRLYADCEGLQGGQQLPESLKTRREASNTTAEDLDTSAKAYLIHLMHGVKRALKMPNDMETTREKAVSELFPRLLYNFSEVIVHVIPQSAARTLETHIVHLLDWAHTSGKSAINRAILPYLVIVINNCSDVSEWDPDKIKAEIVKEQENILTENEDIEWFVEEYRGLGKRIDNIEDLLECFYTKVHFVKIPNDQDTDLLSTQLEKLYEVIDDTSLEAQNVKHEKDQLLSAPDQALFYKLAFRHFSTTLDRPFDFLEKLLIRKATPNSLDNNFTALLTAADDALEELPKAVDFCAEILPVLCSAIALDAYRWNPRLPGSLVEIFEGKLSESQRSFNPYFYSTKAENAFKRFAKDAPCSFHFRNGAACVNRQGSHLFHQDSKGNRWWAPFDHRFINDLLGLWREQCLLHLEHVESHLIERQSQIASEQNLENAKDLAAWDIHYQNLQELYEEIPDLETFNYFSCFYCLGGVPIEILPCGHAICASCVEACAELGNDPRVFIMTECVLHSPREVFENPYAVHLKPQLAGNRIMSLDGGGVRGIVELRLLEAIQLELQQRGSEIAIHKFFDLIGGTSTGGIITVALGIKGWSVDKAIDTFTALCDGAFKEHSSFKLKKWWKTIAVHGCRYNSDNLDAALQKGFGRAGDESMIDARTRGFGIWSPSNKVFVTATVDDGSKGTVIANYVRPRDRDLQRGRESRLPYDFELNKHDNDFFTVWEAARASASAPSYFKPFRMDDQEAEYWDGGLFNNNPAYIAMSEAMRLWPQTANEHPDILLSIGSGLGREDAKHAEEQYSGFWARLKTSVQRVPALRMVKTLFGRLQKNLDSEEIWRDHYQKLEKNWPSNYLRLNPKFSGTSPELDDVDALFNGSLRRLSDQYLQKSRVKDNIRNLVDRLISTTFYLHDLRQKPLDVASGRETSFSAHIRCRFINGSNDMFNFADIIARLKHPHLELTYAMQYPEPTRWPIDVGMIDDMQEHGIFDLPIDFTIPLAEKEFDIKLVSSSFSKSISACPMTVKHGEDSHMLRRTSTSST